MALVPDEAAPHMRTAPPLPTLLSRYRGADGGSGRSGAVHRTVVVAFSAPALALTLVVPGESDVNANVARPPVVAAVAAAGSSSPVPEAVKVTAVPSATGKPDGSRTS